VDIGGGRTGERLSDYADQWSGYAEGFTFGDGSDAIRIVLDADGSGVIEVGDSPPPAPSPAAGSRPPGRFGEPLPTAGVSYPISGAQLEAKRLRFSISLAEAYREWCNVHPPVAYDAALPGVYSCSPRSVGLEGLDTEGLRCLSFSSNEEIWCDSGHICTAYCACTAEACSLGPNTPEQAERAAYGTELYSVLEDPDVDLALFEGGEALVGTLVFGNDERERITVRLTRQH
jgi:hypothetical protein